VQSGDALKPQLLEMFKGVVKISVAPFFNLQTLGDEDAKKEDMVVGEERYGWKMVGKGEVRASWA